MIPQAKEPNVPRKSPSRFNSIWPSFERWIGDWMQGAFVELVSSNDSDGGEERMVYGGGGALCIVIQQFFLHLVDALTPFETIFYTSLVWFWRVHNR